MFVAKYNIGGTHCLGVMISTGSIMELEGGSGWDTQVRGQLCNFSSMSDEEFDVDAISRIKGLRENK